MLPFDSCREVSGNNRVEDSHSAQTSERCHWALVVQAWKYEENKLFTDPDR